MTNPASHYINRELSWLEFNQRVLDEARDENNPLLERLKFIAIAASNLDEFFMVRVGGLQSLVRQGRTRRDPSGMTPDEQLQAVGRRTHELSADKHRCYLEELEPRLAEAGIRRLRADALTDRQSQVLEQVFEDEIYSVLTPMAVAEDDEFPLLGSGLLNVCVQLAPADDDETQQPRFAVIPVGRALSRFVTLPSEGGYDYMLLEDTVAAYIERFFPGEQVIEAVPFRITRSADFSVREDLAADLLAEMEDVLDARKEAVCVRLEVSDNVTSALLNFLKQQLQVDERHVFAVPGPLDLKSFMRLTDLTGFEGLTNESWPPQPSPDIDLRTSMFDVISRRDVVLAHPFESFEPVVRLIEEAADDPDVLAVKQTLYRTSSNSPIVAALLRAAERGKSVTAIVELKARFDEARNIEWAKNLEQAGVQVIYGVKNLKTHAKVCIIIRREPGGIRRYVHFGTGNYNEITAKLYTDISYMTSNDELGADATSFFNAITGYSQPQKFRCIEAAPLGMRDRLLEMIDAEIGHARHGQRAAITAKLNSLVDAKVIDALYAASQAGVQIRLNVRGICCLRPGVPNLSENISVVSIIDRFLEHSRIFSFYHGGDERVFISSADWMPRNLDRRVELLVPVEDPACARRLIRILNACFQDNVKGRDLQPDGTYVRRTPGEGEKPFRSQQYLYRQACRAVKNAEQSARTVFEPYRAPSAEV